MWPSSLRKTVFKSSGTQYLQYSGTPRRLSASISTLRGSLTRLPDLSAKEPWKSQRKKKLQVNTYPRIIICEGVGERPNISSHAKFSHCFHNTGCHGWASPWPNAPGTYINSRHTQREMRTVFYCNMKTSSLSLPIFSSIARTVNMHMSLPRLHPDVRAILWDSVHVLLAALAALPSSMPWCVSTVTVVTDGL